MKELNIKSIITKTYKPPKYKPDEGEFINILKETFLQPQLMKSGYLILPMFILKSVVGVIQPQYLIYTQKD